MAPFFLIAGFDTDDLNGVTHRFQLDSGYPPFHFRYREDRAPYSLDIRVDYHLLEPWRRRQIDYQPKESTSYTVYREALAIR